MAWLVFLIVLAFNLAEEGLAVTLLGLGAALGIDLATVLITGGSLAGVISGAGLADDVVMMVFGARLGLIEKLALSVFIEESSHFEHEAYEQISHTDEQNRQFSRWLQSQNPGQTYLFGDIEPRDVIDLAVSGGYLLKRGTFRGIYDAALDKFGGLVTETAEAIELGGLL